MTDSSNVDIESSLMSTASAMAALALVVPLLVRPADSQTAHTAGPRYEVSIEKNIPATMRDGTILRADVYRPRAPGRFPALLQRTPYSKNGPRTMRDSRALA